jgi:hypothetical protein
MKERDDLKRDLFLLPVGTTRLLVLLLLLCSGGRTALAAGLPAGVAISPTHGLIMSEKALDSLPPWKTAVLSEEKPQPGTRNDRVVYSSRNSDPDSDFMLFTPVCVYFQVWNRTLRPDINPGGGSWGQPPMSVMPANGCFDQPVYLMRSEYEQLGGPTQFNAQRNWFGYLIYPAAKAFVYVRTFPGKTPSALWGKWTLDSIARAAESDNFLKDRNAEFHFDLAKFIEAIGQMAPGTPTLQAAYKYGFYSPDFYAAAGVDASLLLVPVGRAGRAGKVVYGSLMAGTIGISAYNFRYAQTDQDKLKAVLDIVVCLSMAHNVLRSAKPKRGLLPPDGAPERGVFEDLIGSPPTKPPIAIACNMSRPLGGLPSVAGRFDTPYKFLTEGLRDSGLSDQVKNFILGSDRYKKLLPILEKNQQFIHWNDVDPGLLTAWMDSNGHLQMRSTTTWLLAYRDLWHEVLHTEIDRVQFLAGKAKFIAKEKLDDFIKANLHLLDDEAFVWADCAELVQEIEDHLAPGEAGFRINGVDRAAGEHTAMKTMMEEAPKTRSWQLLKEYLWEDEGYQTQFETTLKKIFNRYSTEQLFMDVDGAPFVHRFGQRLLP